MACQTFFFFFPGETRPQKNGILQIYKHRENLSNWTVDNLALWRNFTTSHDGEFSLSVLPPPPQPFGFRDIVVSSVCFTGRSTLNLFIALKSIYLSQISKCNLVKELLLKILALKNIICVYKEIEESHFPQSPSTVLVLTVILLSSL